MVDFKTFLTRWSRSHSNDSMTFDMRKCAWLLMTEKYSKVVCDFCFELNIYKIGKGDHDTLKIMDIGGRPEVTRAREIGNEGR